MFKNPKEKYTRLIINIEQEWRKENGEEEPKCEVKISFKLQTPTWSSPKSCPSTPPSSPRSPRSQEWLAPSVFAPFKPNFRVQIVMWQFLCDCAAAQYSGPKSCRGILFLCNSGSIWAAAQKFHIESCRGSVLFLLKIDFFPSKWVTPMCFGLLSFILTSHLTWL